MDAPAPPVVFIGNQAAAEPVVSPPRQICGPNRRPVADAGTNHTETFFRAHPDALLDALLAETLAQFGDPTGN